EPTPPPEETAHATPPPQPPEPEPEPEPEPKTPPRVAKGDPARTPPKSRHPRQPSATPLTQRAPAGKGTLQFRVRPYAIVYLNGKNLGQTPFDAIEVPAGKYSAKFVNDELKKNVTQTFELKPGESKIVKVNLEE
ncbi:MAG: PEGA domain-containing protein, partial [Myxococcaceae bacterium]|nr:PEGA domain-containing protein [Myxococcaceae bacterium]